MRLYVALAAAALMLAGCSSQASPSKPARTGCALFDQKAVAAALKTTKPVVVQDNKTTCTINVGAAPSSTATPDVVAMVFIGPDRDHSYATWRQSSEEGGEVRDLSQKVGDKAFVAPLPRPHESLGGVLHDGTFYRFSVFAMQGDPMDAANALVDALESAFV